VDLDGDGKGDLVSGGYAARIHRWRGLAAGGFGPREDLVVLGIDAFKDGHVAEHAVDWDGDGDIDLLAGSRKGPVFWIENTGTPKEPKFAEPKPLVAAPPPQDRRGDAGPHAADWDGDGDLDLLVGDASGRVTLYANAGTRKAPRLEAGVDLLPPRGGRFVEKGCRDAELCAIRAKPWVADWNGDGLPDLLVGDFHDHRTAANQGNDQMHGWVWIYLRKKPPAEPEKR